MTPILVCFLSAERKYLLLDALQEDVGLPCATGQLPCCTLSRGRPAPPAFLWQKRRRVFHSWGRGGRGAPRPRQRRLGFGDK